MGFSSHLVLTQPLLFRKRCTETNILSFSYQPDSASLGWFASQTHLVKCVLQTAEQPSSARHHQPLPRVNVTDAFCWQSLLIVLLLLLSMVLSLGERSPSTLLPFSLCCQTHLSDPGSIIGLCWSLLWYNPFVPAQLLPPGTKESSLGWLGGHNRAPEAKGESWGQGSSVGNMQAVSSIAFPHTHIFLPCFNTNSWTLQTSVYRVVVWLFQSNPALRGKLSGLAQVSPNSKYSNMWSGCCKSMLCPDKSYHVPGDEQRNVFWPELAKLPPQHYSLNYSLGRRNTVFGWCRLFPQSTGIWCLRIYARLPRAFVRWNSWNVNFLSLCCNSADTQLRTGKLIPLQWLFFLILWTK